MRYAKLMKNDVVDGEKICVSLWTQGCPHRCPGCHNPETWSYDGGQEEQTYILAGQIINAIKANGIIRNFSVLGGEPLCKENRADVAEIIRKVRAFCPQTKIFLWTGYTYEQLLAEDDKYINSVLNNIHTLIDGPYIAEKRDLTLHLRGSRNQRVLKLQN